MVHGDNLVSTQYKNSAIPDIQRKLNKYSKLSAKTTERGPTCRQAGGSDLGSGGGAQARRLGWGG